MPNTESATDFLQVLNSVHSSLSFTMEFEHEGSIPFLGTLITRCGNKLITEVYRQPTDTGPLLHFVSHVDKRYKKAQVNTMVDRAYRLSSSQEAFSKEFDKLCTIFPKLCYPNTSVNSTTERIKQETDREPHAATLSEPSVYIKLPFKDQRSANRVRREIHSLGSMINVNVKPVFTSRKLSQTLSAKKNKPRLSTRNGLYVHSNVICAMQIVSSLLPDTYINERERRCSAIGRHLEIYHGNKRAKINHLKKFRSKFDCLIYEILFIKDIKPSLNTQSDSIRAKLFT